MYEEQMSIDERYKYLRMMQKRYQEAVREERGQLLSEMEAVTGMHRKSLTRSMNDYLVRKKREKQRGRQYDFELDKALQARFIGWVGCFFQPIVFSLPAFDYPKP